MFDETRGYILVLHFQMKPRFYLHTLEKQSHAIPFTPWRTRQSGNRTTESPPVLPARGSRYLSLGNPQWLNLCSGLNTRQRVPLIEPTFASGSAHKHRRQHGQIEALSHPQTRNPSLSFPLLIHLVCRYNPSLPLKRWIKRCYLMW